MTGQTVELRVTGVGMLLVNGRPATADEARAFLRFIDQAKACTEDTSDEAGAKRCMDLLYAAFGSPPGGLLIKTAEAPDIMN